ncbi:hypothetical protein, partial [Bosea sp. TAB14]|uniref:hypothetical protein n=1 Tax=Bosea sp. TAB14 TaxID=3237481 RepID=UPI003F91BF65
METKRKQASDKRQGRSVLAPSLLPASGRLGKTGAERDGVGLIRLPAGIAPVGSGERGLTMSATSQSNEDIGRLPS